MANDQISLSTVVVLVVISGLAYKYLWSSSSSTDSSSSSSSSSSAARERQARELAERREAAVERLQQIFPHLDRRTLLWDLQRVGGSMQATTERALSDRLETPPMSFQPPPPPRTESPAPAQGRAGKPSAKTSKPNLITQYNLEDRVGEASSSAADGGPGGGGSGGSGGKASSWSANKDERAALLRKRRDDMILAARRKMEVKLAAEAAEGRQQQ